MNPNAKVEYLPGVGDYYRFKLARLGIETLEDLIYHFPFRYDDFTSITQTRDITPGEKLSIIGSVVFIKNIRTRFGKFVTTAQVSDESGSVEVIWFNQSYLTKTLKAGTIVSLSGKAQAKGSKIQLVSPVYEILKSDSLIRKETIHTAKLVPVYPETEGVSSKWIRGKIAQLLPAYLLQIEDYLPEKIIKTYSFIDLKDALFKIHSPANFSDVEKARDRLGFDEIFLAQLQSQLRKLQWKKARKAPIIKTDKQKLAAFADSLPFSLTAAQNRTIEEILADLGHDTPANRLLEGDVGSGKTVVAAAAAFAAHLNGYEVLFAAPTEILAFQHQKTLEQILTPFGVKVGIWTGSRKIKGDLTCGTHALLSTFKSEKQVGLVIVDEQHRFGVAQRAKLFLDHAQSATPHLLTMTATPIPRTLALTMYGDLNLSVLDQMPLGREKVATFVVPNHKRDDAYKFIKKQVGEGRQVFILTPFVEPSETMVTVKAATEQFEKLTKIFSSFARTDKADSDATGKGASRVPGVKLGLLHGQLKSKEKEAVINKFKANKINILVTTPVVEVGIDVPNATVMMIESAERFGLAQLHQLRGRVGRGVHKSYCLLFTESPAANSQKRLKSMEKVFVGFELAEIDLKMRGPGEMFGLKQSGFWDFKIADLSDTLTISKAQQEAKKIVEDDPDLKETPLLSKKLEILQREQVQPN